MSQALLKSTLASLIAVAASAVLASPAHAAEDPQGWVGANFGLSVPNADNTTSRMIWGIDGGAKVGSEFGVGAYYLTSSKDEGTAYGTFGYDLYGIEAAYYFEGEAKGVYVGGRLGLSKIKAGVSPYDISTSPMHYGVVGGYNHFLSSNFSLGGDLSFMAVPESSATVLGTTVTVKSFSMLNFMVDAKFWF